METYSAVGYTHNPEKESENLNITGISHANKDIIAADDLKQKIITQIHKTRNTEFSQLVARIDSNEDAYLEQEKNYQEARSKSMGANKKNLNCKDGF